MKRYIVSNQNVTCQRIVFIYINIKTKCCFYSHSSQLILKQLPFGLDVLHFSLTSFLNKNFSVQFNSLPI